MTLRELKEFARRIEHSLPVIDRFLLLFEEEARKVNDDNIFDVICAELRSIRGKLTMLSIDLEFLIGVCDE